MFASLQSNSTVVEMIYEFHHQICSPFLNLNIGLISNFSLAYMHLVCFRVTRNLLFLM